VLRVLGIPALLVVVFVGVYVSTQDARSNAIPSSGQQRAVSQAQSMAAGTDFSQVVPGLQAYFDQNHTYAGATLPLGSGVTLASADATSYCLQAGNEHEVGPGGQPQPGPC
jgi:hypothetical protein